MANNSDIVKAIAAGHTDLCSAVQTLHRNSKYSDLILKCGNRTWRVHRAIVCPQSDFLDKACSGGFKEAEEGIIHLVDQHETAIQATIDYLYTADFDDTMGKGDPGPMLLCVLVNSAADFLQIPGLAKLAIAKFKVLVENQWREKDFALAIQELYNEELAHNEEMRRAVVDSAALHVSDLLQYDYGSEFRKVAQENCVFGSKVQMQVAYPNRFHVWYRCTSANCMLVFTNPLVWTKPRFCCFCGHGSPERSS